MTVNESGEIRPTGADLICGGIREMVINGNQVELAELRCETLLELIELYGYQPGGVAIERNGEIPERSTWSAVKLKADDRIEIIRFVGGG